MTETASKLRGTRELRLIPNRLGDRIVSRVEIIPETPVITEK